MEEITVNSFCKINIGLNIVSKREDGYHNIETIFYPLKLHDTIYFRKSDAFSFNSNSDKLNSEKNNLVISAVKMLENQLGKNFPVEIFLDKKIPIGAGLGGGSSNAAFTLKALNELFDLKISDNQLRELGLKLGSDVPLFLHELPAYAESRGEKLSKVKLTINDPVLVVNPGIHISTKWAFSKISPKKPETNLKDIIEKYPSDYNAWQKLIKNDFEEVVIDEFNELSQLKNELIKSGADFCLMTGSGSTFFAIFSDRKKMEEAIDSMEGKNYFIYIEDTN
jgi:4-diphosphocytidyl-2-C-methyl-D-erythritol kinase